MISLSPRPDGSYELCVAGEGDAVERYGCVVSLCDKAACNCSTVTLALSPEPGAAQTRWPDVADLALVLDPFRRSLPAAGKEAAPPDRLEFGRSVSEGLPDDDWEMLVRRFLAAQARALKALDPDRVVVSLPFAEVEDEGVMVAYHQVFPYAPTLTFELDGEEYFVDEQYCLRPQCDCTEVCVSSDPVDEDREEDGCALIVDYKTAGFADERTGGEPTGKALRVAEALREAHPDLPEQLGKRHAVLKRVYRASRAKLYRPRPKTDSVPPPKTGRNDPCPCGSGKKFKKCCAS